jgi:hypothetical protein
VEKKVLGRISVNYDNRPVSPMLSATLFIALAQRGGPQTHCGSEIVEGDEQHITQQVIVLATEKRFLSTDASDGWQLELNRRGI